MSRIEWILSGLVALLFIAVVAMALIIWHAQNPSSTSLATDNGTVAAQVEVNHTAQSAYTEALTVAREWAEDAQLLSARATLTAESGFQAQSAEWGFMFYSASKQESSLIAVTGAAARLVRQSTSMRAPAAVDISNWQIDSPAVLEAVRKSGGQAFIDSHQQVSLMLGLEATERLRWQARLFDTETNEMHIVEIDPTYGTADIITQPEPVE
jgi:hypothetical protein